jgi:uncharacterized protein
MRDALAGLLRDLRPLGVAVSGGVDSLTLATLAGREIGGGATMLHAVSPAVPEAATARVRALAAAEGWRLRVIDAGEFDDPSYRANPANRCFFCKTSLYGAMAAAMAGTLASGTNLDDLGDWRPGLKAAEDHGVRHPFVEARMTKADVRVLAAELGLGDIATLPASPCLSSRVETGMRIEAETLVTIDRVETRIRARYPVATVRCRIRASGPELELDAAFLDAAPAATLDALRAEASGLAGRPVKLAPYAMGSAFLRDAR